MQDHQLVGQSFAQRREANSKTTKQDGHHLGNKALKLGRILDGEEMARLVEAREEAGRNKVAKEAQCAPISRPSKTKTYNKAKISSKTRSSKPHCGKPPKGIASPTDTPSGSSYYDIENESGHVATMSWKVLR